MGAIPFAASRSLLYVLSVCLTGFFYRCLLPVSFIGLFYMSLFQVSFIGLFRTLSVSFLSLSLSRLLALLVHSVATLGSVHMRAFHMQQVRLFCLLLAQVSFMARFAYRSREKERETERETERERVCSMSLFSLCLSVCWLTA